MEGQLINNFQFLNVYVCLYPFSVKSRNWDQNDIQGRTLLGSIYFH